MSFFKSIKLILAALLATCVCGASAWAVPVTGVLIDGKPLEVEYYAGSGENTSYVVVDFIGGGSGPNKTYAFGYNWDDAATTEEAMLAIEAAGSLSMETTDYGPGFGLFIDRLAYSGDDDTPDFNIDSRFWNLYVGELDAGMVDWMQAEVGMSQRMLADGSFDGFIAKAFEDTTLPRVPAYALADTDLDGDVDTADITLMYQNFTGAIGAAGGKTRAQGDTDLDGDVDTADITTGLQTFSGAQDAGLATVPEPASATLLLVGLAGLAIVARRRRSR